jgi:hypothetical protein
MCAGKSAYDKKIVRKPSRESTLDKVKGWYKKSTGCAETVAPTNDMVETGGEKVTCEPPHATTETVLECCCFCAPIKRKPGEEESG